MARKTFISYKYSEARSLRDRIISKLGDDAKFYRGEDGFSDDLSSNKASTIKAYLADMLFGTSVTIVILSPEMNFSRWIPWEIEYSLSEYSRSDRTSRTNGIICVVQRQPNPFAHSAFAVSQGSYSWLEKTGYTSAWQVQTGWDESKLLQIIRLNRDNKKTWMQSPIPANSKTLYDSLSQNYIDIVTEDEFLRYPDKYIEEAYLKSQNVDSYNITKQIREQGRYYY